MSSHQETRSLFGLPLSDLCLWVLALTRRALDAGFAGGALRRSGPDFDADLARGWARL
jgi:hypothetical protein